MFAVLHRFRPVGCRVHSDHTTDKEGRAMTRITCTKSELREALLAEFPADGHPEVLEAIERVVKDADQWRGDFHHYDPYLNVRVVATA